jgi:hypothetical protein
MSSLIVAKDMKNYNNQFSSPFKESALFVALASDAILVRLRTRRKTKRERRRTVAWYYYRERENLACVAATNSCTPLQHTLSRGREKTTDVLITNPHHPPTTPVNSRNNYLSIF